MGMRSPVANYEITSMDDKAAIWPPVYLQPGRNEDSPMLETIEAAIRQHNTSHSQGWTRSKDAQTLLSFFVLHILQGWKKDVNTLV